MQNKKTKQEEQQLNQSTTNGKKISGFFLPLK